MGGAALHRIGRNRAVHPCKGSVRPGYSSLEIISARFGPDPDSACRDGDFQSIGAFKASKVIKKVNPVLCERLSRR